MRRPRGALRFTLAPRRWLLPLVLSAGCAPSPSRHPEAGTLHGITLAFVEAALANDTARLRPMVLDDRAMQDAHRLRQLHRSRLVPVRNAVRPPHWVVVHGDTASAVLYLNGRGEDEFGAGFVRRDGRWLVIRMGLSPR